MATTNLSELLLEMSKNLGADLAGIATIETLAGGPPSADLMDILPTARSAVCFGSIVTEAELSPTEPLPVDETYCNNCRLCRAVCPSGFISPDETTTV